MAFIGVISLVLLYVYLLSGYEVRAREMSESATMETMKKNGSISYANYLKKAISPTSLQVESIGRSRGDGSKVHYKIGHHPFGDDSDSVHHWAQYQTKEGKNYYGVTATLNPYSLPSVAHNQISSAELIITKGEAGIMAGWEVNPNLYNDVKTHFFTLWTADGLQTTGCYNLQCYGFVLDKSSMIVPGAILDPVSVYKGQQHYFTLKIIKATNGDWWLYLIKDGKNSLSGYWPAKLFRNFSSATKVQIGGQVTLAKNQRSPPMGSGHFAFAGATEASRISDIVLVDEQHNQRHPKDDSELLVFADNRFCYTVTDFYNFGNNVYGFYFGGPGGCAP